MNILVFNCGSSSLNYKVFATQPDNNLKVVARGKAHRVGVQGSEPSFIEHHLNGEPFKVVTPIPDHRKAAVLALDFLAKREVPLDAVGHRFVHGGNFFQNATRLDADAMEKLQACLPLAPIHNPNSLSAIRVCQERLSGLPQYLTFDTAFHRSMPEWAYRYALPRDLCEQNGLYKFGFHGLSYQYVTRQAAAYLKRPLETLDLVACHLGTGGSSVVAVRQGQSLDTSMGYSPLAGLMMSTRTGSLDPLLPEYLMETRGLDDKALTALFNKKSGLLGVSGFSSDIRDLIRAAGDDHNPRAGLAVEMYADRLKKNIGAYAALLGGMDALIFTDDIGVQNPHLRALACAGLEWCGIRLDNAANAAAPVDQITEISLDGAAVKVLSIPTDEEWVIGMQGVQLLGGEHGLGL